MKEIIILTTFYNRGSVEARPHAIHLFADNLTRTSGIAKITSPSGIAAIDDLYLGKNHPFKTQALIRGLGNAFPITTRISPRKDFINILQLEDVLIEDCERISSDKRDLIVVPSGGFGTGVAYMSESHAEVIRKVLEEQLGIKTVVTQNQNGGYGVIPDRDSYPCLKLVPPPLWIPS